MIIEHLDSDLDCWRFLERWEVWDVSGVQVEVPHNFAPILDTSLLFFGPKVMLKHVSICAGPSVCVCYPSQDILFHLEHVEFGWLEHLGYVIGWRSKLKADKREYGHHPLPVNTKVDRNQRWTEWRGKLSETGLIETRMGNKKGVSGACSIRHAFFQGLEPEFGYLISSRLEKYENKAHRQQRRKIKSSSKRQLPFCASGTFGDLPTVYEHGQVLLVTEDRCRGGFA